MQQFAIPFTLKHIGTMKKKPFGFKTEDLGHLFADVLDNNYICSISH